MTAAEAVVAGSPQFLEAVLGPLQARLGGMPKVADTPHLAFALCQQSARLLVYEFCGQEWLPLCDDLRRLAGPGISIVVALPPERAAAASELSKAASAVVAWNGEPRPVLEAVGRVVAPPAAPPGRRPVVLTPLPGGAVPAAASAVTPPSPPAAAQAPLRAVASTRAAAAAPVALGDRGPPPLPFPKSAGTAAPVLASEPAPAAPPGSLANLFDEPTEEAVPAAGEGDADSLEFAPASTPPIPLRAGAAWPGGVLDAAEAQGLLAGALVGLWPEEALRPVTEKVLSGLSVAEKSALQDQPLPLDAGPLRRAAGLRWQVVAALASVPAPGAPVDQEAVRKILACSDEVLAELKAMGEAAAPEALRIIETVRHAVVREAIDLTEAVQRVVPAEVAAEITASQPLERAAGTRVIFSTTGSQKIERRTPWVKIVVLGLALMGAAGYHGYRYVNRPRPTPPALTGAPSGSVATPSPHGKLVFAPAGKHLDPREIESFKNAEVAKGNEIHEVLPDVFMVTAANAKGPGTAHTAALQGAKQ